jgi:hypothetical protein
MPHWETRSNHIGKLLHHPTSDDQPQQKGKGHQKESRRNKNKKGKTKQRTKKRRRQRGEEKSASADQTTKQTKKGTHGRPNNKRHQEGGIKGTKSTCLKCVYVICLGGPRVPWF